MRTVTLLGRNLAWYWRTNLAVVLGVAVAVGVLAGALLVGESVRSSLRELALKRLGNAEYVVSGATFFREELAAAFPDACPLIALEGVVTHETSGRRAMRVAVYGVDERFWKFQSFPGGAPRGREAILSPALVQEFASKAGDAVLVRVEKATDIPLESLHGRKDDVVATLRLAAAASTAEFALRPQQGDVRTVLVPLRQLQRDLGRTGRINAILTAGEAPQRVLSQHFRLEDLGVKLRILPDQDRLSLESESGFISDDLAEAVKRLGASASPVLAYLANGIRAGAREIPYSLAVAMEMPEAPPDTIILNDWAARELGARPGDPVSLDYFVWQPDGGLRSEAAQFRVWRVVPIAGFAADRNLVPDYPGITESESLHEWDPPFPIDLKRIRPSDEEYWKRYRTTPKAFVPLARGQQLWQTRFGRVTSIRIAPGTEAALLKYTSALRAAIDPARHGLITSAVKAEALSAAQGSTDFGEYFAYFSFFLMASALLLTGLFFKLGVEQRMREIGALRALGFTMGRIRTIFLCEGIILATVGAVLGAVGALAYAGLILLGLRTWWIGAVGTRLLSLHVSFPALAAGMAAGIVTGIACVAWTLRSLQPVTPRGLLAEAPEVSRRRKPATITAIIASAVGVALLAGALIGRVNPAGAFFGAGGLLLIATLCAQWLWLSARRTTPVRGIPQLGFRNASDRPGRSILCITLIASATFLIVSVDAFRRGGESSGAGGFSFMAESVLPLVHDPNSAAGREALNLPRRDDVRFVPFRLKPGDDASCLNLYQPRNPRVLAPPPTFLNSARFEFQETITKAENPWLLLSQNSSDGAIPAIADATSMTYALHRKLGEVFALHGHRFRVVATLRDSIFQGELLISDHNFVRLFPDVAGYRFFLLQVQPPQAGEITGPLEDALSDYGFDIVSTQERLAGYHRVENTYLSTFQALGALGLVLGTIGLGAIVLRNVLERRQQLAMLRAVGYHGRHLRTMALAENALLLVMGLLTGALCALLAVSPAAVSRGGRLPSLALALLLGCVLASGLAAAVLATTVALRSPLLAALRSE